MQDWQRGRSLLGFLSIKVAQDSPSLAEQGAVPSADRTYGPRNAAGVTNVSGMASMAAGAVMGDDMGAITQSLMPLLRPFFDARGIDITKPYQLQYGQSANDAREMQQVQQAVIYPAMEHTGQRVHAMAGAVDDIMAKMGVPGFKLQTLYDKIPGTFNGKNVNRDMIVGQLVSTIAQADPKWSDMLQNLDNGLVLNWQPLINATYARNGGRFNAQDFTQLKSTFDQLHQGGHFRGIPAQAAIEAMPYAMQVAGPNATAQQITSLALVGKEIQQRGMAPTLGAGMEMATSMGNPGRVLSDPRGVLAQVEHSYQYAKRLGMDPQQFYGAVQAAKEKGMSPVALMEGMGAGTVAARGLNGGAETSQTRALSTAATEAYSGIGDADSMKALAALKEGNRGWSVKIDRMIANGDIRGLNRVTDQAMRTPSLWRAMQTTDPSSVIQRLGERPGMLSGVMQGELARHVRLTGNRELGALLANPQELTRRLAARDFSGLSDNTKRTLSVAGPNGGRFAATFLATQQSLKDLGYKGRGRLQPLEAFRPTKDLDRPVNTTPGAPQPGAALPTLSRAPVQPGDPWQNPPTRAFDQPVADGQPASVAPTAAVAPVSAPVRKAGPAATYAPHAPVAAPAAAPVAGLAAVRKAGPAAAYTPPKP